MKDLGMPEKRTEVLYSRISPTNKKFLSKVAKQQKVSESAMVDHILDMFREQNAGNKRTTRKRSK